MLLAKYKLRAKGFCIPNSLPRPRIGPFTRNTLACVAYGLPYERPIVTKVTFAPAREFDQTFKSVNIVSVFAEPIASHDLPPLPDDLLSKVVERITSVRFDVEEDVVYQGVKRMHLLKERFSPW